MLSKPGYVLSPQTGLALLLLFIYMVLPTISSTRQNRNLTHLEPIIKLEAAKLTGFVTRGSRDQGEQRADTSPTPN